MKSSEMLEEAAKIVACPSCDEGVCLTLRRIARREGTAEDRDTSDAITARISNSITPSSYISGWLRCQGYDAIPGSAALRDYRAAWCRWMADGYRAIGD